MSWWTLEELQFRFCVFWHVAAKMLSQFFQKFNSELEEVSNLTLVWGPVGAERFGSSLVGRCRQGARMELLWYSPLAREKEGVGEGAAHAVEKHMHRPLFDLTNSSKSCPKLKTQGTGSALLKCRDKVSVIILKLAAQFPGCPCMWEIPSWTHWSVVSNSGIMALLAAHDQTLFSQSWRWSAY